MKKIENIYSKPTNLKEPIEEFKTLLQDEILSIDKMEWWLIKYETLFEQTYDYFYHKFLYDDEGVTIRLPSSLKETKYDRLIDLYKTLDNLSKLHRKEGYFKKEIRSHNIKKKSKGKIRKLEVKNGKVKGLFTFLSFRLYDDDTYKDEFIEFSPIENFVFFIKSKDFKYSLEFFLLSEGLSLEDLEDY